MPESSSVSGRAAVRLPFDACFPAHLKFLLAELSRTVQDGQAEQYSPALRRVFEFLMQFWSGAALGALERLQGSQGLEIPERPDWSETLRLLRYAVTAWEGYPQSSFRTLLRLGYFEAGDPPRPRLQCRWLGIAGEWNGEIPAADAWEAWQSPILSGPLPRYLELLHEWLRASRALFVKLKRRYGLESDRLEVVLEDGRGKQIPLMPAPAWEALAGAWSLEQILAAEAAETLEAVPISGIAPAPSEAAEEVAVEADTDAEPAGWLDESIDDILAAGGPEPGAESPREEEAAQVEVFAGEPEQMPEPELDLGDFQPPTLEPVFSEPEPFEPEPWLGEPEQLPDFSPIDQDGLDALLGLDIPKVSSSGRWRPRPLEFPGSLPQGVRSQLEIARKALLDYAAQPEETPEIRRELAAGLVTGLDCLLELTARVACAGLAQVAPLPDPLRLALQQPVPAGQSVKLLHFAWAALQEYPKQPAQALLQSLFFEVSAPDVPRLHARWLGLPDGPMIGLQHVTFWTRHAQGQIQASETEFQVHLRELLDALQLWLVAGGPLWAACDPELNIRPDGHWSGFVQLGGDKIQLDPDTADEEPLDVLLERWRQAVAQERPVARLLTEIEEFVASMAPGSGLLIQGPAGLGKSYLLHDLAQRQPQVGSFRCGWIRVDSQHSFALEELNAGLAELHVQGFPWFALGRAALADLQRHSPREYLFQHYFAALKERNQGLDPELASSLRIVLLEDGVADPESLRWCHLPLPAPFQWVATSEAELPEAWNVPCPPGRLSIAADPKAFEQLQLDFWRSVLDWSEPQLLELIRRSEPSAGAASGPVSALLVQRLWAGALQSGLYSSWKELPEPEETAPIVLGRLLEDRAARPFLAMLSAGPRGIPLSQLLDSPWSASLRQVLQHYSWLLLEPTPGSIALRENRWSEPLKRLAGPEREEVLAQFCQYLIVKLNTEGALDLDPRLLLDWISASGHGEAAWATLQSQAFRGWKDETVHRLDSVGLGQRKIGLVDSWLAVLELALHWAREEAPLQLHEVQEEQLWSYSSRGMTYRSLGRLQEALLDVEQAIAGFRPLVEQRPALSNGLAAAHNRRSEILHELGQPGQALEDADIAVHMYAEICPQDPARWSPLWALALHQRSNLQQELGRLGNAEDDLRDALKLYQPYRESLRPRMRLNLVEAYLSRAGLAARRGDGLLARDDAQRCLELLGRFEEKWTELRVLQARAQTQLAEAFRLLEDENKALEVSDQAISLWQGLIQEGRLDLRGVYGQELCRRGSLLFNVGQLDAAFEAAQPGTELLLQLVEAEGRQELTTELSRALLLRARIWQRRGRPESARRDLTLAFHYLSNLTGQWETQANNPAVNVLVDTVALLSQLQLAMNQREQAVEHLRICLEWVNFGIEHTQQENRALLESLLGRAEQQGPTALEAHQRALSLYTELVDEQGQYQLLPRLAEAHLGRARTYRLMGEEELALADANQAVELVTFLSEKGGDPGVLRLLPAARFEAAEILGLLGQSARALEHLDAGLYDLELIEQDLDRAEYLLERARALLLRAGLLDDQAAVDEFSGVLEALGLAQQEGAETQFIEAEVRRQRAEVLLRLGRTAAAVEEMLGWHPQGGDSSVQAEQARGLLDTMLAQARRQAAGPERADAYRRLIQVAELLYPGDSSGAVGEFLLEAYCEKALANWDRALPWVSMDDLTRGLALCAVLTGASVPLHRARLFECRASLAAELGKPEQVLSDVSRALEGLGEDQASLASELLWHRVRVQPLDAGAWGDLSRLAEIAPAPLLRADAQRAQAAWLQHHGWGERAQHTLSQAVEELRSAYTQSTSGELAQRTAELQLERFQLGHELPHLLAWVLWLGDHVGRHPEIAEALDLAPVWTWLESSETSRVQLEQFSQVWLALLAEHPDLPETLFRLVPFCVLSLRLDEFDSSTWISLMDILDRRAKDEEASRLDWEGKTLHTLLELPRQEVSQNPDLDMALADCLRRWAELPPERLALTGVSVEALDEWLMS